jgi:hypothetical protein
MSGRRIDDHSCFAGKAGKNMVMPMGVHTKELESDGHAGALKFYEDTEPKIVESQKMAERTQKGHDRKNFHRN